MTEGFAYVAFLTVTAAVLGLMTIGLVAIGILLVRQNLLAKKAAAESLWNHRRSYH